MFFFYRNDGNPDPVCLFPVLVPEPEVETRDPDFRHLEAAMAMRVVKPDLPLVQRHLQVRILSSSRIRKL